MRCSFFSSDWPVLGALLVSGFCLGSAALGMTGCAPESEMEAQVPVVRAVWDPTAGTVPTPTDLVRDTRSGRLKLPIDPADSTAQREFNAYLNGLNGYPIATTLKIPMSGEVYAPGLPGAFFAMDIASGETLELALDFDAESNQVSATPTRGARAEFSPGRSYVFGIRGYDGGLQGAFSEPVIADAGFYLVRSNSPLDRHPEVMPGESEAEKHATAEQLRAVQQGYAPLIDMVTGAQGFRPDQLAVLASFTTTTQPAVWFDPNTSRIPLPNQLLIDPQTGKVNLPIGPEDAGEVLDVKQTLSEYDGFAISAALVLASTHPVDVDSVMDPASVRLFEKLDDGALKEVTALDRGVLSDGKTFWIRPKLTLEADTDYVYLTTKNLVDTRGEPLRAQPVGAMLRSAAPLFEDGKSQLSVIDDATAGLLEPVRQRAEPLLDRLGSELVIRQDIGAAVPFHTVSAASRMLEKRAELYTRDVRTDIINVVEKSPLARGLWLAMPEVRTIVSGEMFVLNHLDPRTRRNFSDGHAEEEAVSFVLTIPAGVEKGTPIPVVLFGHGLLTSRELTYLIANKLASAGYAVFSLDLPYHGKRAVCAEDVNCAGNATCDEIGQCIKPDGSVGEIATVHVPFMDFEYPSSTGFSFVDVKNLIGTRDHFSQALLDLMQGLRVIKGANWGEKTGGYTLDGDDVVYLGMSLGGILGANVAALEPDINTFVLNVPGGDYLSLVENSGAFRSLFAEALAERGAPQGSDAYFEFANIIRWLLDPVDPLNIAQHAVLDPLTYVDPVDGQSKTMQTKRVLIQMAKDDAVVPNISTEILAERMGVPISHYEPTITNHGFLFDPTSLSGMAARREMVEFFNARE